MCPLFLIFTFSSRDITSGQSLEDVDISVHCDVTIFEWLMDWLKAQAKDKSAPEAIDIVEAEGKESSIISSSSDLPYGFVCFCFVFVDAFFRRKLGIPNGI